MLFKTKKNLGSYQQTDFAALLFINKCVPIQRNEFLPGRAVDREEKCMKDRALVTTFRDWEDGGRKGGEGSVRAQALETDIEGSPTKSLDSWRSQTGLATQSGLWTIFCSMPNFFLADAGSKVDSGIYIFHVLVPFGVWSQFLSLFSLGLCCCAWVFFSCREQGLLSSWGKRASPCGGLSRCGAWAVGAWASVASAPGLSSVALVVVADRLSWPTACGIFPDKGWNLH